MPAPLPPLSGHETHGERRRATILFADIQDSTELIRDLDPEAATQLLDPPVKLMLDAVARCRGTVSHVLGDGIVAIFGAPAASEDHAVMACLAALTMLKDLQARHAGAIRARIGIHSGEVVFRHLQFGRSQTYDSIGATVHIAARLEQTAEPGTVCISASTYALAKGFIDARRLMPVAMKGIDGGFERFLLLGMNEAASRWSVHSAHGLSAFTGRADELRWLEAALQRGIAAGRHVAHVFGPPGIGKSRLLHEFLARSAASCCVLKLAGSPHLKAAAYQPVRSWLLDWIGIRPDDSVAVALDKLEGALRTLEDFTETDYVRLSSLLGLRDGPSPGVDPPVAAVPLRIEQTLAKVFAGSAGGKPIVLACDDADCLDPLSVALLEALVAELASPLLLLTTSRTRLRIAAAAVAHAPELKLRPLPDGDAERLLVQHNPRFLRDRELTRRVIQKTGGNPLFLEEVASLVVRAGPRSPGIGGHDDDIDRAALEIPDRVEALIADRLADLPGKQRRLLELCAVIGNDVPLYLLRPLAGLDEDELGHRLERLRAKRLIHGNEAGEGSYSFRHSIIRDVCLKGLLQSVRRSCHARILAVLEADVGPRHDLRIDDLWHHAAQAGLWDKAVIHLRAAADAAIERSAYKVGELYLVRALDVATKLPEREQTLRIRMDILLSLRALVGATGKYAEISQLLDQAEDIARRLGDRDYQARVLASRIHVHSILGDLGGAVSAGDHSRALALKANDRSLLALSNFFLGQAHFNRGDFARAERAFRENAGILRGPPIELRLGAMATLTVSNPANLAAVQAFRSRFGDADRSARQALQAADATRRPYDVTLANMYHGVALLHRRSVAAALEAFRQALDLARQRGLEQLLPPVLVGIGQARLLAADTEASMDFLRAARELSAAQGRHMIRIWAASSLALLMIRLNRLPQAVELGREAVDVAARFGFAGFQVPALRALGLAQAAAGRREAAATLRQALKLSRDVGAPAETAHCHMALSICGRGRAGVHDAAARRLYGELGMGGFVDELMAMPRDDRFCLL